MNKSSLYELFYDPLGGWKYGQSIGAIGNHSDHVHVAASRDQVVALGKYAQSMGLHVSENPAFGGVNPVHVANSFHYKGEAIDVSGPPAKMRAFALAVAARYGIAISGAGKANTNSGVDPLATAAAGLPGGPLLAAGADAIAGTANDAVNAPKAVVQAIVDQLGAEGSRLLLTAGLVIGGAGLALYGISRATGHPVSARQLAAVALAPETDGMSLAAAGGARKTSSAPKPTPKAIPA